MNACTPFVPWPAGETLILASASPRRAELLAVAGIPCEVRPAPHVETALAATAASLHHDPVAYASLLAGAKADAVAADHPGRWVLGADTVVVLRGGILEKPRDAADALRILRSLRGERHTVVTAFALRSPAGDLDGHECTEVEFLPFGDAFLADYVATGEPMDKAGAYAVQGLAAAFVSEVRGSVSNVIGLPLLETLSLLKRSGLPLPWEGEVHT
jgi:septum formation protein